MKSPTDAIVEFITLQMDGQTVPPNNSAELERLSQAVKALQKGSALDHERLGLRVMGAVIDRVRAGIGAEYTLRRFITGEDHDV